MLTVVAIIAVLTATSIPIVNSSLEKAQKATDAANERAAKGAMMMESLLTENTGTTPMYYDNAAGKWKTEAELSSIAAYGKCKDHKDCYLKGNVLESGVVRIVWANGTDKENEKTTLCSGETVVADSGGGVGGVELVPLETLDSACEFTVQIPKGSSSDRVSFDKGNNALIIKEGTDVTISSGGKPTNNRIVVEEHANANITLKDVNITSSPSFSIQGYSKGNVTITLEGTNKLTGRGNNAALEKNGDSNDIGKLTIKGPGSLDAITDGDGSAGAGIGGYYNGSCRNIEILSGTITAIGAGGAGIGGGTGSNGGSGSYIYILGGTVTAKGNANAAGIGGGSAGGKGSHIYILGGTVTATGGSGGGAGIGGGGSGSGSNIEISGSEVTATGRGGGEDIGCGIGKTDTEHTASVNKITVNGKLYSPIANKQTTIHKIGDPTSIDPPPETP